MATNFPTDDLTTLQLDSATDDPSQARIELLAAVQKIQAIIAATGTSANHSLKLDSNGEIPSGIKSAGTVSNSIQDNYSSITLEINSSGDVVISNNLIVSSGNILQENNTGLLTIAGGTSSNVGANLTVYGSSHATLPNVTLFRVNGVESMRIDATGNTSVTGSVALLDNKHLYLGSSNDLDIYHNETHNFIDGRNGDIRIRGAHASALVRIQSQNSGGTNNEGIIVGGSTPNVVLYNGGVVSCSTQSGGIAFNADTAAANTLDDYEEGTWTPYLSDGTNNATTDNAIATYEKIGRQVTITIGWFSTSSLGSVSGNIKIYGLPYTAASAGTSGSSVYIGHASGLAIPAGNTVTGYVVQGTSYLDLQLWDSTAGSSPMLATEWTNDGRVFLTAVYHV